MAIGIEDRVVISAADWPVRVRVAPGDFSIYAPVGLGLGGPSVMQPWDDLSAVMNRASAYGANDRTGDPLRDAPVNDAAGGVIYFADDVERDALMSALALMGVRTSTREYALYAVESPNPVTDRYLAQLRIVDFGAMDLFGTIPGPTDRPCTQTLDVGELATAFVEAQQTIWGRGMSSQLRGTLGGDGDWAKESLSFGFMVENSSNGVYRMWSRPWLVTK